MSLTFIKEIPYFRHIHFIYNFPLDCMKEWFKIMVSIIGAKQCDFFGRYYIRIFDQKNPKKVDDTIGAYRVLNFFGRF